MPIITNQSKLREKYAKYFALEKPYGWMIEELVHSLYERGGQIQGNYLTAIGLFCYSEIVGREIMKYKNSHTGKKRFNNKKCFDLFLREYMEYEKLMDKYKNIYDWYRHGLCHEYKIKGPSETGVFVYYDESSRPEFENFGVDTAKGILLSDKSSKRMFIILPYLEDFVKGIEKFLKEKKAKNVLSEK